MLMFPREVVNSYALMGSFRRKQGKYLERLISKDCKQSLNTHNDLEMSLEVQSLTQTTSTLINLNTALS